MLLLASFGRSAAITQLTGMTPQVTLGAFGGKSHGHSDLERKNNNKVESFSNLFFMSTLAWITENKLE